VFFDEKIEPKFDPSNACYFSYMHWATHPGSLASLRACMCKVEIYRKNVKNQSDQICRHKLASFHLAERERHIPRKLTERLLLSPAIGETGKIKSHWFDQNRPYIFSNHETRIKVGIYIRKGRNLLFVNCNCHYISEIVLCVRNSQLLGACASILWKKWHIHNGSDDDL